MIVMILYALAAAAVAVLVTVGYVMLFTVHCEEELDYLRQAKRELDADREEYAQKEAKEAKADTNDSRASLSSFPSVKKSGGAYP